MTYTLLPFRFERFNKDECLIVNEVGEFIFITNEDFEKFVTYKLDNNSDAFLNLKAKQVLTHLPQLQNLK